jgi:murein DD-endopeptidase MepM/ murein hydrolase activator NlpD
MQSFFSKKENMRHELPEQKASFPKIALQNKAFNIKASFLLVVLLGFVYYPSTASANFFGDVFSAIVGSNTYASVVPEPTGDMPHNSQTVPLLESNLTPELKNTVTDLSQGIVGEQAIESTLGDFGNNDVQKYATSEKISTYVVKKGDTIDGIALKLKVSKESVVYAANLKKGESLKIGKVLSIIPVNVPKVAEKTEKTTENKEIIAKTTEKKAPAEKPIEQPKKIAVKVAAPSLAPVIVESAPEKEPEVVVEDQKEESAPAVQENSSNSGRYIWPFPKGAGRISQGLHSDNAYDFAAPVGTPIYAVYDGSVLIARPTGYNGGYGLYVVIDFTDGRQAIFGHMSKVAVKAGDEVKKGDIIGYVGNTGKSTGPHLHLGFHGPQSNPYLGLKVNARDF